MAKTMQLKFLMLKSAVLLLSQVDEKTGRVTGKNTTYAVCGYLRAMVGVVLIRNTC